MEIPHFIIKNRFQKGGLYQDLLSPAILTDVCRRITGQENYTVDFIDEVNKGRLAKLFHNDSVTYISFSENRVTSRNSSFQSFPSALVSYLNEDMESKRICYFILETDANIETDYFLFMYRLMKTVDTEFLIESEMLSNPIRSFTTVEDIILNKNNIRGRNRANNSSYITKSVDEIIQVFGKLYGANKYETSLLCLALYEVTDNQIELFEIEEGNLKKLPKEARDYLLSLDRFSIVNATIALEESEFRENDSLRSPRYIYNLLEKVGDKKCALCECEIPQIIQGAHIWPVADIKRDSGLSQDEKLERAIDGDNGLWLCNNHHKLLDSNIIRLFNDCSVKYKTSLSENQREYLNEVTTVKVLSSDIVNDGFTEYLTRRNQNITEQEYADFPN
jgi:hypothetical protein